MIVFEFVFHPGNRDEAFIWENFHPGYRDPTEISVVETEISVTGLARLLIWRALKG